MTILEEHKSLNHLSSRVHSICFLIHLTFIALSSILWSLYQGSVGPTSHRGWPVPSEAPSTTSIHNSPWVTPLRMRRPERAGITSSALVGLLISLLISYTLLRNNIIPIFCQSKSSVMDNVHRRRRLWINFIKQSWFGVRKIIRGGGA